MTEKENLMRVIRGEDPEWVPRSIYSMHVMIPSFLRRKVRENDEIDILGVEYVPTDSTGGEAMVKPGFVLLEDISDWREVVKLPDPNSVDWAEMAKKDLVEVDRDKVAVQLETHIGYFINLMNIMGFENGLIAMATEPAEVKNFLEYMAEFFEECTRKGLEHYKPDLYRITDDICSAQGPFMSLNMYRDLIKPLQKRLADICAEYGVPVEMHCCGKAEMFLDDWVEIGVISWNPAQTMNDLPAIKAKHGKSLVLNGCWDSQGPVSWPGATEETVKSEVRKCIDAYAPGGGFIFGGLVYADKDDRDMQNKQRWINEEYDSYGRPFYKK
jgi:hypothetical protein